MMANAMNHAENTKNLGSQTYLKQKRDIDKLHNQEETRKKRKNNSSDSIDVQTPRDPSIVVRSELELEEENLEGVFVISESPEKKPNGFFAQKDHEQIMELSKMEDHQ